MRPDGRGQAWWWPVVPAAGFGLVALGGLTESTLLRGGLAPLAAACVFVVFGGLPAAEREWAAPDAPTGWRGSIGGALVDTAAVASLAAGLAAVAPPGPTGWIGVSGAWAFGLLAARWPALLALGPAVVGLWIGGAFGAASGAPPWGVLEPAFASWRDWLPAALGLGALVGWAPGQWGASAAPAPGRLALPAVGAGLALLGLIAAAVWRGAEHTASIGASEPGVPDALVGAGLAVAAGAILGRTRALGPRIGVALAGVLATVGFAAVGSVATGFWWSVSLPLALGIVAGSRALAARDPAYALAGLALVVAPIAAFPGMPEHAIGGVAVALPWVIAAWIAGTRALRGAPTWSVA